MSLLSRLAATDHPRATTAVIQQALDEAGERGGGMVRVPPGTWTIATLFLRSGTTLHLERGCVLAAHDDLRDYPSMPRGHNKDRQPYHLIAAQDAEQITLEGDGVIDGRGERFWYPLLRDLKARGEDLSGIVIPPHFPADGPYLLAKPQRISPLLELCRCRHVVLRDFLIRNSPGWTIHPYCCDQVRIDGVTIENHLYGPNTDGIDVNGCRDVLITNCRIVGCDDNIILKATADARCCQRIAITNCTLRSLCAAVGLGAEVTCGIRDVTVSNCVVEQAIRMVQFQLWEAGVVENVSISNLVGRAMTPPEIHMEKVIYMDIQQHSRGDGAPLGVLRNITIQGVNAETKGRIIMTAQDGAMIEDVVLRDIHLTYPRVEDNPVLIQKQRSQQNNNFSPDAQRANAVVVARNMRRLKLADISARLPAAGPGVPAYHALWARNVQGIVDCPWLTPNQPGHPPIHQEDCDLQVRAIG